MRAIRLRSWDAGSRPGGNGAPPSQCAADGGGAPPLPCYTWKRMSRAALVSSRRVTGMVVGMDAKTVGSVFTCSAISIMATMN